VLVVSADVGSQASVVPEPLLVPRAPIAFLREAERVVIELCDDPERAAALLPLQRARVDAFAALPRARDWTRALYERWAS
jgi:hypothetical protein